MFSFYFPTSTALQLTSVRQLRSVSFFQLRFLRGFKLQRQISNRKSPLRGFSEFRAGVVWINDLSTAHRINQDDGTSPTWTQESWTIRRTTTCRVPTSCHVRVMSIDRSQDHVLGISITPSLFNQRPCHFLPANLTPRTPIPNNNNTRSDSTHTKRSRAVFNPAMRLLVPYSQHYKGEAMHAYVHAA